MSEGYEEIIRGERFLRRLPGARHEAICARLHDQVALCVSQLASTRLLPARSIVQIAAGTLLRPDLALITVATGKIWLAAEVISAQDHQFDTVVKKAFYEEIHLPRLWMIDPRYDNLEVYHTGEYGMALKSILAIRETLTEPLLPAFALSIQTLFDE